MLKLILIRADFKMLDTACRSLQAVINTPHKFHPVSEGGLEDVTPNKHVWVNLLLAGSYLLKQNK